MSPETSPRSADQPGRSPVVWFGLVLLMLMAGMAIPSQGRVNTELSAETGDATLAAILSFASGLLVMIMWTFGSAKGRAGMGRIGPALRSGEVKWWYLLAGFAGGYFVLTQTLTIGVIGVAIFSVAVVTGQTVGGLLWDRIGLGPAGRKKLTGLRVLGAALTVVAVLWAVSPQLTAADRGTAWLLLVILPFTGGFLQAGQQALNGRQSAAYRGTLPGTLINFAAGLVLLLIIWAGQAVLQGVEPALSPVWWHYAGGPLGIIFIALGAFLVTRVGVLVAAMGMIAGQLLGSLLLDLIFPTPGSVVAFATVAGTLLTLLAVVLASLPDFRRGR